ncbi:MAG: pentapeptide repeat-containing protein [Acaryochloris sp. RU_4_1]|nr:pentapeptide repeat-containing protein [Acaryochloris sp. RU_4_1]NJR55656.1 pentapeptide repeat-containing protein [Acaryochloris sp. CRU_2_0]
MSTPSLGGCITGIRQEIEGDRWQWWYQLMSPELDDMSSSTWWAEDSLEVTPNIFSVDLLEGNNQISRMYVGSVDEVLEFVEQHGDAALRVYEQTGRKQEIRILFCDVRDCNDESTLGNYDDGMDEYSCDLFLAPGSVKVLALIDKEEHVRQNHLKVVSPILKEYENGKRDFSYCDLKKAFMPHSSLPNINLFGSDLTEINLSGSDMQGANLGESNLKRADLRSGDFRQASFLGADLENVNLENANLQDADLMAANLKGARLAGAKLKGADLMGTVLWDVDLSKVDLREVDLQNANLNKAY